VCLVTDHHGLYWWLAECRHSPIVRRHDFTRWSHHALGTLPQPILVVLSLLRTLWCLDIFKLCSDNNNIGWSDWYEAACQWFRVRVTLWRSRQSNWTSTRGLVCLIHDVTCSLHIIQIFTSLTSLDYWSPVFLDLGYVFCWVYLICSGNLNYLTSLQANPLIDQTLSTPTTQSWYHRYHHLISLCVLHVRDITNDCSSWLVWELIRSSDPLTICTVALSQFL